MSFFLSFLVLAAIHRMFWLIVIDVLFEFFFRVVCNCWYNKRIDQSNEGSTKVKNVMIKSDFANVDLQSI